jgi:hypothetical protein
VDKRGGCVQCGQKQNWADSKRSYARMLAAGVSIEGGRPVCGVCATRLIRMWKEGVKNGEAQSQDQAG